MCTSTHIHMHARVCIYIRTYIYIYIPLASVAFPQTRPLARPCCNLRLGGDINWEEEKEEQKIKKPTE